MENQRKEDIKVFKDKFHMLVTELANQANADQMSKYVIDHLVADLKVLDFELSSINDDTVEDSNDCTDDSSVSVKNMTYTEMKSYNWVRDTDVVLKRCNSDYSKKFCSGVPYKWTTLQHYYPMSDEGYYKQVIASGWHPISRTEDAVTNLPEAKGDDRYATLWMCRRDISLKYQGTGTVKKFVHGTEYKWSTLQNYITGSNSFIRATKIGFYRVK